MKLPKITLRRAVVLGAVLLLVAGVTAPYLRANRFGNRIRESLESALGRKVKIDDVRFDLFRGPGFELRKVVIYEDPAFGIEPFAYVASVETRVRFWSLLRGKLEFAGLRLVEPSVNFVKNADGAWNFQPLVGLATAAELPEIRVRRGRLNFKFGDTKSPFYVTSADVDVDPPSAPGRPFDLRFAGEPARTDRASLGLGRLTGRGRWRPARGGDSRLELDLELEKSALANASALLRGSDMGIHGEVAGRARLSGPISALDITGRLELRELHRWDSMPPYAKGGVLNCRGRLDLVSQTVQLETVPGDSSALPLWVRFRAVGYLSHPRWAVTAAVSEAPLAPLVDLARHMGLSLPESLEMDGTVDGAVGYSPGFTVQGVFNVPRAQVRTPGSANVQIEEARVVLDGERVRVSQALMRTEKGETARVDAQYLSGTHAIELKISTDSLEIASLRSGAGPLLGLAQSPLAEQIAEGRWQGTLRFRRSGDEPGEWSGAIRIQEAKVSLPALADPIEGLSAAVSLQASRFSMSRVRARLGKAEIEGEYNYQPGARRPHRFQCRVDELSAAELERLLMPALRRPRGLLSRAFGFGRAAVPGWLRDLRAEGTVEIGSMRLRGLEFEKVKTRVFWDGAKVEATTIDAHLGAAEIVARLGADLRGIEPVYEMAGEVRSLVWKSGKLDGDGTLRAAGIAEALLANLRLEGDFTGHSLDVFPGLPSGTASGCYEFTYERGQPRLSLKNLRVNAGSEAFTGEGDTHADGSLDVVLSTEQGQIRLVGKLSPFQLAPIAETSAPQR